MEETIGYEALLSADEWDSLEFGEWDPPDPPKTNLPESDALRIAMALDDYELVTVTGIGGSNATGFWIAINDRRFDTDYEICSHADYWEVVSSLVRSVPAANSRRGKSSAILEVARMHLERLCRQGRSSKRSGETDRRRLLWDFISYFAAGQMWPVKRWPSVGPRSSAATSGHEETEIKSEEESSTAAKKHKVSVTVVQDGYQLGCSACEFCDHVCECEMRTISSGSTRRS